MEPRGDRQYLAGLRMNCGVPTVASCAAPPPPVLPSPSLSPVVLPPVPVVVPTPLPVLPGAPAGAPEPTPLPALPGAPAVAPGDPLLAGVSPWLGPKAGPGSYRCDARAHPQAGGDTGATGRGRGGRARRARQQRVPPRHMHVHHIAPTLPP